MILRPTTLFLSVSPELFALSNLPLASCLSAKFPHSYITLTVTLLRPAPPDGHFWHFELHFPADQPYPVKFKFIMGKTKKHASMSQKKRNQARLNNAELVLKEDMQTYGMVTKPLGDRRFLCTCADGKQRQCKIRGKFRGRLYVQVHDILLISLREDEDDKADIIQKYRPEEVAELKKLGEFTDKDFALEGDEQIAAPADDGDIVWTNEDIDNV